MIILHLIFVLTMAQAKVYYLPLGRSPPIGRSGMGMSYSSSMRALFIFGGHSHTTYLDDTWAYYLDGGYWKEVIISTESLLSSRFFYGSFTSAISEKFYIFGGCSYTGLKNDLWEFDPSRLKWTYIETINPPSVRHGFSFTSFVEDENEIFTIFGGESTDGYSNDLYILNMTTLEWHKMINQGNEVKKMIHNSMNYYKGCLYMTNGFSVNNDEYMRLYKYCFDDKIWIEITDPNETEPIRVYHKGFIYENFLYVLPAGIYEGYVPTIKIDLDSNNFMWEIDNIFPWLARYSYAIASSSTELYIFGGVNTIYGAYSNELLSINLYSGTTKKISLLRTYPEKRVQASMTAINGELYLFGGKHSNTFYNNLWVYNVEKYRWRSQNMSGEVPSPRYSHAVDSDGFAMILFGGEDVSGLKDDMFIFNSLTYNWKMLTPKSEIKPKISKGACLVFKFPLVYIYGGKTSIGSIGEFWIFDIGSLEYTKLPSFVQREYPTCFINDDMFYVFGGGLDKISVANGYLTYNFSSSLWKKYMFDYYPYLYIGGLHILLNNSYVSIGGHYSYLYLSNLAHVLMINGSYYTIEDNVFSYVFFSAYAYYGNYIYSFGRSLNQGRVLVSYMTTNNFYYIKMEEVCSTGLCYPLCSIGTYEFNKTCIACEPGTYSDIKGSEKCSPCPLGTYNKYKASSSFKQCLPCPEGTFNNKEGSSICLECSSNYNCPAGSKNPSNVTFKNDYSSIQPKKYSPISNKVSWVYALAISIVSFLCLCMVVIFSKLREKLRTVDLFKDKHNHVLEKPMILKKKKFGGFFSIIFTSFTIIFVGLSIIEFNFNNIQETKALVPLVVLSEDVDVFTAGKLEISCTFVGYGGKCSENNVCDQEIFVNITNLQGSSFNYSCSINENESCVIKVTCYDCELLADASVFVNSKERLSYASEIYVNITSNSSIPNEISSIKNELYASKNYLFIGSEPSEFYYTMTPSLFQSESSSWPSQLTGYHISDEKFPLKGSQSIVVDLPIFTDLKVMIYLYKSNSCLQTKMLLKQSILLLIAGILGSVFGIFGAVATFMEFLEGKFIEPKEKFIKKIQFAEIKSTRKNITDKNFTYPNRKKILPLDDTNLLMSRNFSLD